MGATCSSLSHTPKSLITPIDFFLHGIFVLDTGPHRKTSISNSTGHHQSHGQCAINMDAYEYTASTALDSNGYRHRMAGLYVGRRAAQRPCDRTEGICLHVPGLHAEAD